MTFESKKYMRQLKLARQHKLKRIEARIDKAEDRILDLCATEEPNMAKLQRAESWVNAWNDAHQKLHERVYGKNPKRYNDFE